LVEWQVIPGAWIQVFHDPERAGKGLVNFAVDDLEHHLADLRGSGLDPDDVVDADNGVRLSAVTDPDGNTIRFIGGFRVEY
jgi:catechol 2,3-dioxygenase-like lactoylglutathione lyase family enzyme